MYFLLPHKGKIFLLLVASFLFYMAFIPSYALILVTLILIDYFAGLLIEKTSGQRRKTYLLVSLVSNLLFLGVFKYFNFFNANIAALANFFDLKYPIHALNIILPIGLSFHTFQAMAYTIEVYRKRVKAERNLFIYALYVMFFPQLVAGPIERPFNLLPQLKANHRFDYQNAVIGLRLILYGLFKKMVIADNLAPYVSLVFKNVTDYQGITLILGMIFFAFQIYCDFSGYSDIAIGCAQMMGYKLVKNFDYPYFSRNIGEFWQRWHISLSSWFRDYVYIPLGGSRVSKIKWWRNIFMVFILSGLWHGANWVFAVWGVLHGVYYLLYSVLGKMIGRLFGWLQILLTFSLVCVAWIFFRAQNLDDAWFMLTHLTFGIGGYFRYLLEKGVSADWNQVMAPFTITGAHREVWWLIAMVAGFVIFEFARFRGTKIANLESGSKLVRWVVYLVLIFVIVNFGAVKETPFIYFQF
jgi:D-alanyl-lipoteichoic acid acyltransferase DltB (MBOAT superfamily)